MEKDKKIKVINVVFLVVTIIYAISSFANTFLNESSEYLIWYLGMDFYLIGFVAIVIEKIMKKESKVCSSIFLVTTIITAISFIIYNGDNLSNYYFYSTAENALGIIQITEKVLLAIMAILYFAKKKNNVMPYIFFISTIIYCVCSLLNAFSIICWSLIIVSIYIALYLMYENKGVTEKTFRNIIIVLIITILTILIYIFYSLVVPKIEYNKVVSQLEGINQVNSSIIPIRSVNLRYKTGRINYKVSRNIETVAENMYNYNDNIAIFLTTQELDSEQLYALQTEAKRFMVNRREFFIVPSTTNNGIASYTRVKNNLYCAIFISFTEKVSLTEEDLQNIKPFFDLTIR